MLATVLDYLFRAVRAGMTTAEIDKLAKEKLKSLGGQPAFLDYQGFSGAICTSINDEVVHGVPSSERAVNDGDILSLDFGVLHKGLITDSAISFIVGGKTSSAAELQLLKITKQAMETGIDQIKDGVKVGTIGAAIENVLKSKNLGIVREFVGHGVGHQLHESPNIPNYGVVNQGPMLHAGMTVAIEPMATLGSDAVFIKPDGWTVATKDGKKSAHFEQTVLVTEDGYEVLTPFPGDLLAG